MHFSSIPTHLPSGAYFRSLKILKFKGNIPAWEAMGPMLRDWKHIPGELEPGKVERKGKVGVWEEASLL